VAKEETGMRLSAIGIIVTLALGLLLAPLADAAQPAGKVRRIGFLAGGRGGGSGQYLLDVCQQGLRELGWVEGQNLVIEWRRTEGRNELLHDFAAELVRLGVEVIVVGGGEPAVRAAMHATSTIPIVMGVSAAPVETGLVTSLARPGGNVTGLSIMAPEGGGKRLELLKDAVPQASRIAVLWNATFPGKALEWQATQAAAQAVGVTLHSVEVRRPDDFNDAFATIARERPDALIVFSEPLALAHKQRIVDFTTQHRLPMISETREFAEAGGLMTYGASLPALFHRAAYYVDRILKGKKPADLPVEQPWKFEFVINLKTAEALGLTLPPHLLAFANEIIR
jgi:putative ABC transport system substrate-binding protein